MKVEVNKKIWKVIYASLVVFALIVSIVVYFLEGDFLLTLIISQGVAALGYAVFLFGLKRVVSIELNESNGDLLLRYNRGGEIRNLPKAHTTVNFELRKDGNDNEVQVLVIRESDTVIASLWPGSSGYTREDLEELQKRFQEIG